MQTVEDQLRRFRATKTTETRPAFFQTLQKKLLARWQSLPQMQHDQVLDNPVKPGSQDQDCIHSTMPSEKFMDPQRGPLPVEDKLLRFAVFLLKAILWCLLMALFTHLEFGAVFFVFSVFYCMYANFRTDSRKPDELSAYSVFNPQCEAIDGTLKAEQFEKELIYGLGAIH